MRPNSSRNLWQLVLWGVAFLFLIMAFQSLRQGDQEDQIPYSRFKQLLRKNQVLSVTVGSDKIQGQYTSEKGESKKFRTVPLPDSKLVEELDAHQVSNYSGEPDKSWLMSILMNVGWIFLFFLLWWFLIVRQVQMGGKQALSFGRSRSKMQNTKKSKITFADVAGCDEAKEELQEIIEFLKNPAKFQKLGGKIPRGVLLYGIPGTGKTLLARAVAGEAGVPFFSSSGSEFVEMFVGVGASVTGDTPVLIRKNGRTRLLPIAEFVDAYYRDGEHNRAIPIEDVETLGFFERESKFKGSKKKTYFGGSRWIRVSEVFRHKAGKVFEIHYLGGQIRTTEDHSIFIRTRNGIRAVATRDLKPGDRLVCLPYLSRKLHHHRDKKIIPFEIRGHCWEQSFEPVELPVWSEPPEWAEKYAFAINQKAFRSQHAIAQAIGVSQATVGNWQRFFHKPQALSDQRGFSRIPQKVMLSPQLLTLFGLYTAEGRSNGGPEFCFGAHESALHQETLHLMRQIFGVQGRVETTDTNSVRLHFPPPLLGEFFESHCGNGAHHKHVPEFLWNCPREYFLAYLEGWLKGDGYAAADGKLSGTSVSKRLIRELLWLCSMHGIKAGMRKMVFPAGRQIRKNGKPLPETTAWNLILSKSWNPFRPGPQSPQSKSLIVRRVVEKPHAGYVYDLCGCDGEAFFGGDKPILLHNSRVRDLFEQAKKNSPAVIFVDELDAVGRYRFAGIGGGHDEREQTLNQLLVELDGFDTKEGVIFLGSTNRPDVIDPALLRPGRFDRHVNIPPPDIKGREQILKVHAKKIKLAPEADLSIIARRTPGFVGADLANLVNEGALLAARRNKPAVEMPELEEAIDRVMAGPQRKSRLISDKEKKIVAYHEAGHALVAKLSAHADPVHKVSIIPRGPALGYTLQLPTEDRLLNTQSQLTHRIQVLLGGRCAEEVVFLKEITTGAQDDLEKATHLAHKMVTEFGMSPLGPVSYKRPDGEVFLGRDLVRERGLSEMTASSIDREVKKLLETCYQQARAILLKYRAALDALAAKLVEQEVLEGKDVDSILKNYSPA